jgi:hypothetical protein
LLVSPAINSEEIDMSKLNSLCRALLAAGVALTMAGVANAGSFEVAADTGAKADQYVAIVSFTGDGVTQDAQLDLTYSADLEFVQARSLVAGSVCAGFAKTSMVRAVPPSGAGSALPSKTTGYCSFSFRSKAGAVKGDKLTVAFQECASPSGTGNCSVEKLDLSRTK